MLEIFILIAFGRKLASLAKEKGRTGAWALLGVGMWIGGELFGAVVGALMGMEMGVYVLALFCAALGAAVAYGVVSSLPALGYAAEPEQDLWAR